MNPKVLTPELLESVVGGVDLSDNQNAQLLEVLVKVKTMGIPKETVIAFINSRSPMLAQVFEVMTPEEAVEYVELNWDNI